MAMLPLNSKLRFGGKGSFAEYIFCDKPSEDAPPDALPPNFAASPKKPKKPTANVVAAGVPATAAGAAGANASGGGDQTEGEDRVPPQEWELAMSVQDKTYLYAKQRIFAAFRPALAVFAATLWHYEIVQVSVGQWCVCVLAVSANNGAFWKFDIVPAATGCHCVRNGAAFR